MQALTNTTARLVSSAVRCVSGCHGNKHRWRCHVQYIIDAFTIIAQVLYIKHSTYFSRGSHSLAYIKILELFPWLSRTPKTFFQDRRSTAMLNYEQTAATLYIQCDSTIHCKSFITRCKETVQLAHDMGITLRAGFPNTGQIAGLLNSSNF